MKPTTIPRANLQKAHSTGVSGAASPSPQRNLLNDIFARSHKPPSRSGSRAEDLDALPVADVEGTSSGGPAKAAHIHATAQSAVRCQRSGCAETAEQLLTRPLCMASTDLPEQVQGYLQLLAESSSSNGTMQRHLLHLVARGAADAQKLQQLIFEPIDGVADVVADHTSTQLLQRMQRTGRTSDCGAATSTTSTTDSAKVNPIQGKVLSLALSAMMSGLAQSATAEATQLHLVPGLHAPSTEIARSVATTSTTTSTSTDASFFRADSVHHRGGQQSFAMRAAPSVVAGVSASGASALLGAGGMATSTALKMLRADSRVSRALEDHDLSNLLGAVLDTVSESTQDPKAPGGLSANARKGLANMITNAQHSSMAAARNSAA